MSLVLGCENNRSAAVDEAGDRPIAERGENPVANAPETQAGDPSRAEQDVLTAGDPLAPPDLRRQAVVRIANSTVGDLPIYVDLYRAILETSQTDATVAAAAAIALAKHGQPADALLVANLLDNDSAYTRWQAANSLARLHYPPVANRLTRAVRDDDDADVRQAVANALGQYPQRNVYDALLDALGDRDSGVSRVAERSLRLITGHDAGDDPRAWLEYADAQGTSLFNDVEPYTYAYYPGPPPAWLGILFFWMDRPIEMQTPTGYDPPDAG
jgi:HEAT repeat protein